MNVPSFLLPSAGWTWQSTITNTATGMLFAEASIFNKWHLDIVAPSPKNNNPNISSYFLIMAKFLFMFCSWITSSSSFDMSFLLGVIYVFKTFLDNSSTLLNLGFRVRWKGRTSEIIRSAIAIVRWVSLEVINFWELSSIPKISEPFEKFLRYSQMISLMQKSWYYRWSSVIWWSDTFVTPMDGGLYGSIWLIL